MTNQDLVAIAALALYAQLYGDASRFMAYGQPSLDIYLGPKYYYSAIGLTERGDSENFVECTAYYEVILRMLEHIRVYTGDDRLLEMADTITVHLFDALFTWEDGLLHLSWGAKTFSADKSALQGWNRTPITLSAYPGLIGHLWRYLARHPDESRAAQVRALERTLAAYVFADGMIPAALGSEDPLFSIVTSPVSGSLGLWTFLIDRLGDTLCRPDHVPSGCIHRTNGRLTWKSNNRLWAIERDGKRLFTGLKPNPGSIAIGPDETIARTDLAELDGCDTMETVTVCE